MKTVKWDGGKVVSEASKYEWYQMEGEKMFFFLICPFVQIIIILLVVVNQ